MSTGRSSNLSGPVVVAGEVEVEVEVTVEPTVAVAVAEAVAVTSAVAVSPGRELVVLLGAAMAGALSGSSESSGASEDEDEGEDKGEGEGEGGGEGEGRRCGGSSAAGNGDAVRGVMGDMEVSGSAAMVVSQGEGRREACDASSGRVSASRVAG